jgi:hypothetical protein
MAEILLALAALETDLASVLGSSQATAVAADLGRLKAALLGVFTRKMLRSSGSSSHPVLQELLLLLESELETPGPLLQAVEAYLLSLIPAKS